jgi:hypothetical protein
MHLGLTLPPVCWCHSTHLEHLLFCAVYAVKPQSIISEVTTENNDKCQKMISAGKALNVSETRENKKIRILKFCT